MSEEPKRHRKPSVPVMVNCELCGSAMLRSNLSRHRQLRHTRSSTVTSGACRAVGHADDPRALPSDEGVVVDAAGDPEGMLLTLFDREPSMDQVSNAVVSLLQHQPYVENELLQLTSSFGVIPEPFRRLFVLTVVAAARHVAGEQHTARVFERSQDLTRQHTALNIDCALAVWQSGLQVSGARSRSSSIQLIASPTASFDPSQNLLAGEDTRTVSLSTLDTQQLSLVADELGTFLHFTSDIILGQDTTTAPDTQAMPNTEATGQCDASSAPEKAVVELNTPPLAPHATGDTGNFTSVSLDPPYVGPARFTALNSSEQ